MAQVQPVVQHPLIQRIDVHARLLMLPGVPHQQPLAKGRAQRIHRQQLALGVLARQLLGCRRAGVVGAAEARGEADIQYVPPGF